ncbi:MAG: hypothetical protein JWP25_1226 [Bradyrhizobium sp.]|nr:hypothetical protein [Bradyrhizobium sp.]
MSTAMTPFRWKNCFADVQACKHDITIRSYLDDVIVPALKTLDRRIDELGRSNSPGHEFAQADMEDVLRETKMAFSLSIQSIWERQLRAYLRGCANELRPHTPAVSKVEKADWRDLRKLFDDLRGIAIESFPSFDALDILHHLGNACRHGDGRSTVELSQRCPDLWPPIPPLPPEFGPPPSNPPSVAIRSEALLQSSQPTATGFSLDRFPCMVPHGKSKGDLQNRSTSRRRLENPGRISSCPGPRNHRLEKQS